MYAHAAHTAHIIYCGHGIYMPRSIQHVLSHRHQLEQSNMPTLKVSLFGKYSLWIRQHSPRMLSIKALAVRAWNLVLHGHTPFHKRGKGSGNFLYGSLLHHTAQCGTNHSAVLSHECWYHNFNRKWSNCEPWQLLCRPLQNNYAALALMQCE